MTPDEFIAEWLNDSEYIHAHTSGSTGVPKAVQLLKSDMLASARATNKFFGLGPEARFLCPLSPDYIAGKMMAVRAFAASGDTKNVHFVTPSNNPEFSPCDLLAIVPSQVEALLNSPMLSRIHNVIIGGAQLSDERRMSLCRAGVNAYESYGMTETCSHVALKHVSADYFTAMPGVKLSLDERGCLAIEARHLSVGCIRTNDIAQLITPTAFRWLGRFDNIINSGGIKIVPEQQEQQIRSLSTNPLPDFYISSMPDSKWGNRVVIVTEGSDRQIESLKAALTLLPSKTRPKEIIRLKSLPRTTNGKIRRLPPGDLHTSD